MSDKPSVGPFTAEFRYDEAVLSDFEALYLQKKEIAPGTRIALGVLGAAGAVFFGWSIYRNGLQLTYAGYLIICSLMLLVALARPGSRPDDSLKKYRKYYLDHGASFRIDENGVEMRLEGQKNPARSKFKEIYGLYDTDRCLYFVIKGKAYYILPRESVSGGTDGELAAYMQRKCGKRFVHYDVRP